MEQLIALQTQAEEKAAAELVEAAKYVGFDNDADIFHQGKFQAYRDMAQSLSAAIKESV